MKRGAWLPVCGLVVVSLVACGGADQSPLLQSSGGHSGNDASVSNDGGTTVDSGGSDVTVQDAPSVQDVVTVDVPVGPPDSKIQCGPNLTCSAKTQVCCATVGFQFTYQCVSSVGDCAGANDIPISCSSGDNCASQGHPGDICCGTGNGPQNPSNLCQQSDTASQVQCQTTCDPQQGEFEIGCSPQLQNCTDNTQTCIASKCTLPGYGLCQ
jgi:hypothetical protein